jgi:hypothetical protein
MAEESRMKFMKRGSQKSDIVLTPTDLAQRIINHVRPSGRVLDPCRGEGAFDHLLVTDWCEISEDKDFFQWGERVDWIIGNPPWSQFGDFNRHALDTADNVVWLYHIPGLLTKRRIKDATDRGFNLREIILIDTPPDPWPQSGFQVAVAWWSRTADRMTWTDWRA